MLLFPGFYRQIYLVKISCGLNGYMVCSFAVSGTCDTIFANYVSSKCSTGISLEAICENYKVCFRLTLCDCVRGDLEIPSIHYCELYNLKNRYRNVPDSILACGFILA